LLPGSSVTNLTSLSFSVSPIVTAYSYISMDEDVDDDMVVVQA